MDVSAVVLNKLILERSIDIWAKLKLSFLDSAYSSIYSAISKHYEKYSEIPSFEELEATTRESATGRILGIVRLIDEPNISGEVALDALLDQYTQNQAINMLDKFIDKLPIYDSSEIKENLSGIVLALDDKTLTTEGVYNMADIMLFKSQEETSRDRVFLGVNNDFDAALSGVARQELILVGGARGSGKSIVCSNICINQYEAGNTTVLFSIEMIAHEVNQRDFSILADIPHASLKNGNLTKSELLRLIQVRASMFEDAQDLVTEFCTHEDRFKFEAQLVKEKKLKEFNQIIIIDDRALTISSIDLHLGKLRARFGDKLTVAVVDYVNQVVLDGYNASHNSGQFDWKYQVEVAKQLKNLARKHDVVLVSPYQIDATGEARFAKGILDAGDIAVTLTPHRDPGAISFETTKIRSGPPMSFISGINWDTLRISPKTVVLPAKEEKPKKHNKQDQGGAVDVPWNM